MPSDRSVACIPAFKAAIFRPWIPFHTPHTPPRPPFPDSCTRRFQRASLGKTLKNLGLSFPVCKLNMLSYWRLLSEECCEVRGTWHTFQWKGKAEILWKEKQGQIDLQTLLLAIILVNIGETLGRFTLTPVKSKAHQFTPRLSCVSTSVL